MWEALDDLKAKLMLNRGSGEISQPCSNIVNDTTKCGELHGIHSGKILSPLAIRSKGHRRYKRK